MTARMLFLLTVRSAKAVAALAAIVASASVLDACSVFDAQTGDALNFACSNDDSDPAREVTFKGDIRPIMNRLKTDPNGPGCRSCHYDSLAIGGDADDAAYESKKGILQAGLDMTTLGGLRRGGKTSLGVTAVPGKPCDSAIIKKLRGIYPTGSRMPRESPRFLNDTEIQLFSDWIAEGAKGEDSE